MPVSNVRLPKVTQYVRNVGKSVAFASINAVKNNMEGIKGFAEDNEDVFVEIYSGVKNYRETIKKTERSIRDSNLYKAIEYGAKNLVEDAKSGNFYNDRTSDVSESALGVDDDSLGLDFDYEVTGGSSSSSSSKYIADSFNDAMKSSTIGTTTAVAKGTDMVVRSTKASTTILSTQIEKSTATIHSGLGAVYNSVNQINQFLNGPMMTHLENSRTYYDNSLKLMQEQHAMMKEMLEMQRNLYGAQAKQYSTSRLDQSMGSNGMVNLRGYGKVVKNNLNDILSMYGLDMLISQSGINTPMLFAAAPFKILMDVMFDSMMPKNIKKNLKAFDTNVSGMFGQFIGKMNKNKGNASNTFLNLLGQLFGIDIEDKKSINTGKYNKGAVAFDGITRKTIVEVIPGYLARIEAALTGAGERHYDSHSGKWKTARQIEADFEKERISAIESANRGITYDIAGDKRFQSRSYQKAIRKFKEQVYEDGYFNVGLTYDPKSRSDANGRRSRTSSGDSYKKYGFKDKKSFDTFLSMLSDETIAGLAVSNQRAKQARSRRMQEYEDMGSVYNILFNDTYNDGSTKSGAYSSPSKFATGGLLNKSTDKYGKNVFYYLREILNGINSRWRSSTHASTSSGTYSGSTKVRKSRSREYTTSSESEDDSGSDDDDEWDSVDADLREQEERAREEREKKNAAKDWVDDNLNKSPIGKFFKNAINGVSKIISSPLKFINDLLEKANNNMFSLMFGNSKTFEVNGKTVDNVFEFIIEMIKNKFDELGNFIRSRVFNPILDWFKEKIKPYAEPVWNELKKMGGAAKSRVKRGLSNTFGKGAQAIVDNLPDNLKNKLNRGGVATADEIEDSVQDNDEFYDSMIDFDNSARGRIVTKRGLTMISPGEVIIPASFDKRKQNKMLALEKRDRKRIINAIGLNASGNVDTEDLKKKLSQIYEENKGDNKAAKVGAGGIVGFGAGLLTGFNPLLAAMAGAGISILNNSDTLKNIVFGEVADEETGDRNGGLISKKIQDTFKKYAPDMGDYGIAGGVLGLITPFGPFMGAAIGAGIGFLKNSEGFKKFVFGEEGEDNGLISRKAYDAFKDKVKEAAPKMLVGAGAGILAGPFGLLGNAAIGAGVGLISTTETFQNFLYGEEDENGERNGGVLGAFKTGFLEPAKEKFLEFAVDLKEYSQKHIFEPMKNFWKPVNQMLKNVIQSTGDKITDHINDMFERTVGLPLHDFLQEKLFKPISKVVFGILKAPYNIGKAVISAPFRALGGIGNSIIASQIRRGTAYDMTANERLAWRDQHGVRFNKFNAWKDKTKTQDQMLADMDIDQLEGIFQSSKAGLDSYASLQKQAGNARKEVGNEVSKFFNTSTAEARNRFNKVGYNTVKKLTEIAQTKSVADANEFIDSKMKGLTDDEKDELKKKIAEKVRAAERANSTMELARTGSAKLDENLSKALGYNVKGRKDRRKIMRSAEAELKARRKISEKINESPEVNATNNLAEILSKKSDSIIDKLIASNNYLEALVNPNKNDTNPPSSKNNENKSQLVETSSISDNKPDSTASDIAAEAIKEKEKKSKSPFNKLLAKFGVGGAAIDEDSKEGKELKAEAEEDDIRDEKNLQANKEQVSVLTKIKEALVGKKDTEESGFLGKLWKGLGKVGKWLGIGGLVLTGTSLFGHLSEWFKTSVWPNLKTLLFGTKDADGNTTSQGLFGNIRTYLFGDGTEENKGLFGNTRDALSSWWDDKVSPWMHEKLGKAKTWINEKVDKITSWLEDEGGFAGIFSNHIVPGFVNGLGYAINNLLGPAIGGILKAAPSLLSGLGKAILEGLKIALFNKGVGGSRTTVSDNGASDEYLSTVNNINSAIEGGDKSGVVSNLKSIYNSIKSAAFGGNNSSEISVDFNNENTDANNITSNGLMGALGQTKRTNNIEYDENGNITTDYTTWNTTDSLLSKGAKVTGRNFLKGLGGNINTTYKAVNAADDLASAGTNLVKSGALSKIKSAFGFTKAAAKTGGNIVGTAGNAGSSINNIISNSANAASSSNYVGKFLSNTADDAVKAGTKTSSNYVGKFLSNTADDAVKAGTKTSSNYVGKFLSNTADDAAEKTGILKGISNFFAKLAADNKVIGCISSAINTFTGKGVASELIEKAIKAIGDKLGETIVGKVATSGLKALSNILSKFSILTIANFAIDFIWGYNNAYTILGVAADSGYNVNLGMKCVCGIVNVVTNFFTLGLIPADIIMDIAIEFLAPLFNIDVSEITAARELGTSTMDAHNLANPDNTFDNLQDYNNYILNGDKWWYKASQKVGDAWDSTKEKVSSGFQSVKEGTKQVFNNVGDAWNSTKEKVSSGFQSVKEGTKQVFNNVASKTKEITTNALDIGSFIKDVTANVIKSAIDPEYTWSIDDYIEEDDPLAGIKKTIYQVMKIPLSVVGMVSVVSKKIFDGIKSFTINIKDGIIDAQTDISAATKGQYSVFSSQYWNFNNTNDDNPLSTLSKVSSTILKVLSIPQAMLGYVGSKVWNGVKTLISGAKEGMIDASSDIAAVKSGQYTIFSSDYWHSDNTDEDNPLSTLGKIFSFITRLTQAPSAMLGYVGTKVKGTITNMIGDAKEGLLDASSDIAAVRSGKYTIFSSNYWHSDNTDEDNPLSTLGSVFSFITRLTQAPSAMLGYVGTKVKGTITNMISGAKEGMLDASSDIAAVRSGKYTIFSSNYWHSDNKNSDNPLSTLGSVFSFITRLTQAPSAMLGYVGTKIKNAFEVMINGAKDISDDTNKVIAKAENGTISVFSDQYWKVTVDENNPLGLLGKVMGIIQRLINAPMIMIKSFLSGIADKWQDVKNWFAGILGESNSGDGRAADAPVGNTAKTVSSSIASNIINTTKNITNKITSGSGHIYQSGKELSNMPYGDSTIGDSGCAPVAAANLLSDRGTASVRDAARYAERNGMTVPGGGTSIDFFNSYLGSKGISTRNSSNRNTVMNALANGNQVIMLGQDNYNAGAPFGTNPHFITAKGISANGNIIVEDPDLPYSSIEYNPNDVMGSMITSVIAGNGRKRGRGRRILFGKGQAEYNLLANGGYTVTSTYDEPRSDGKTHRALDLVKYNNAPINAFTDGTVKYMESRYAPNSGYSGSPDGGGFGNYVTLIDKDGYYHVYAHLNGTNVSVGQSVARGQQIGIQGHTGSSTGSHLHYQISSGNVTGPRYNPYDYLLNYNSNSVSSSSDSSYSSSDSSYSSSDSSYNDSSSTSSNTSSNTTNNLMTGISNLGTSIIKAMYGENAYEALFGSDTTTDISSSNATNDVSTSSSTSTYTSTSGTSALDTTNPGTTMAETYTTKQIWNALRNKGYTKAGTAGIMGNMNAESGYRTNNLQDTYNSSFGLSDEEYSNAVSNKSYSKDRFVNDSAGYGLVQFTYNTLKKSLYEHTVDQGRRIDDLQGQIDALSSMLSNSYSSTNSFLKSTSDVAAASDRFLKDYERPANPELTLQKRRDYAWQAYNTYSGSGRAPGYFGNGRATYALNNIRSGRGGNTVIATQNNSIDYVTFLKTIIEILISISNNTALLNKILEVLSSKFGINIDANQVTNATSNTTTAQAQRALDQLINSKADSSSVAKLINNKDTQYLLNAMAAIAGE